MLVDGTVHGDKDRTVENARSLSEVGPDEVTFIEQERTLKCLNDCRASVLVLPGELVGKFPAAERSRFTLIETKDPLLAFVRIFQAFQNIPARPCPGIAPQAVVDPTATLGADCTVMPLAVVGKNCQIGARCVLHPGVVLGEGCRLGDDVVLHPGVILYSGTILGNRVTIHSNSVLGADGFGYRFQNGRHVKVPQLGHVEVSDDVEIGSCATVDRGTFQATRVGEGTKIDNLVMIAHNCRIGQHNLIISQVGIAGSCTTGSYVVMAGQVGVADHVTIHDGAVIGAGSGVPSDIPAGQRMLGYPCWPERDAKRILMSLSNLPDLCRDVRQIKKKIGMEEPSNVRAAG